MSNEKELITHFNSPIYLQYHFTAGASTTRFLHAAKQGRLIGERCERCKKVNVPPRGPCPICGISTSEEVEVSNDGVIESFTIVHLPIPTNPIKPPFIVANIKLDGSDITFIHLVSECENEKVMHGMRVTAVWKPENEWDFNGMANIKYFKPIAEAR